MRPSDGNHAVPFSCVCVIVQLYRENAVVFDFCVENIQKFAADIGITLIALVPADMYEEYSQRLSCSVEKYEKDFGFNKNLTRLLESLEFKYIILGFDDIYLKSWNSKAIRRLLCAATDEDFNYLRLTRRPPSLGTYSEVRGLRLRRVSSSEAYQASLVYSLINRKLLKSLLTEYKDPWAIEQRVSMSSYTAVFSADVPLIKWKNILVKGKLDYFETRFIAGSRALLRSNIYHRSYSFKRHFFKFISKVLYFLSPTIYHHIKSDGQKARD